jgi:putative ABC transport system ATP-binding protein
VLFAQRPTRRKPAVKLRRAQDLVEAVGLGSASRSRAGALSGGEQQSLSVATALANGPRLLLADEPTSQLDGESASQILDLLRLANRDLGTTIITVTHDRLVAGAMDRTLTIKDGRVGVEGRSGEEYLVVGRDGTIQLPEPLLDTLPPGSLATAHRTAEGVELRPAQLPDQT